MKSLDGVFSIWTPDRTVYQPLFKSFFDFEHDLERLKMIKLFYQNDEAKSPQFVQVVKVLVDPVRLRWNIHRTISYFVIGIKQKF